MNKKELYQKKLQAEFDQLSAEIDKLKAKAELAQADAQLDYYNEIENCDPCETRRRVSLPNLTTPATMHGRISRKAWIVR